MEKEFLQAIAIAADTLIPGKDRWLIIDNDERRFDLMTKEKVVVVDAIKPVDKGSLKAFATVTIADKIRIHGIRIVQQADQAAWVSLPQNEVKSQDGGKSRYFPVVEALDENLRKSIIDAVLAEYHSQESQGIPAGW